MRIFSAFIRYKYVFLHRARGHGGVRITWKNEDPGMIEKWNPFSKNLPFVTFAHHPLIYHEKERETVTFNVDDFHDSFIQQVNIVHICALKIIFS